MTSYNYSYNVLINRLEAFAAGHFLIKRFTHGQIDMSDQLQDDQYPFMHVTPDTITPVQGGMQFGFHIMFADIPRDKEYKAEYQREVISDCVRLGQDLIAEVKNGLELFGFDVQLVNDVTFEPFMEEQKNTVTGVAFTIQLEVPWDWSACDIPAIWSTGGASGSGGSGTGYGIELQTNGVDNIVQTKLNLVEGTNITITDLGNGSVTIDAGGSTADYVSTAFNANHTTATGNQYVVGDRVWYNGSVYQCIANNDAINPTNTSYWTLVAVGYRLRQTPVDWNATTGDFQVLNKPTIPAAQVNSDWNSVSGVSEILNKPTIPAAQVNSDWNAVSGLAEILNKPTIPTTLDSLTNVNAPAPSNAQVLTYDTATSQWIASTPTSGGSGTVTSVGLTMPAPSNPAFSVTGSPVTISGTFAVGANGTIDQYIDGTGALRTLPSTGGGGGQIFYFNGNVSQGTIGGNAYYQLGTAANTGSAANFTRATTGVIARFITNVGSPNHLVLPSGVWTIDVYLSETGGGSNHAQILAKLYTYNGSTFTLVATSTMEEITNGNVPDLYSFTISVPTTTTLATDRIHIEFDIQNTNGKTVTLYTEDGRIGEVHTTYAIGISSLNGLTDSTQNFAVGTAGSDFAISSASATHTFNLPTASAANRGALSSADWSAFNAKVSASRSIATTAPLQGGGDFSADRTLSIADAVADGTTKGAAAFATNDFNSASGVISLDYANGQKASASQPGFLSATDFAILKRDTFTLRPFIGTASVADNATYFFGEQTLSLSTSAPQFDMKIPYDAILVGATMYAGNLTTNASAEQSSLFFRLNNTTDTLLSNQLAFNGTLAVSNVYTVSGLSVAVSASDTFVMKWTTPTWATNPTAAQIIVSLFFERV